MLKRLRRAVPPPVEPAPPPDAWSLLRSCEPGIVTHSSTTAALAHDVGLSAETIVAQLFEGILGRPAAAGDVEHYAALVRRLPDDEKLRALARILSNSGETRARLLRDTARVVIGELTPVSRAFDHVVSFGTHCYSATLMQMTGVKTFSTPFDWVFSTPEMIAHCLQDDFRTFLDPRHHVSIGSYKHHTRAEHMFYKEHFGVGSLFNHRDPTLPGGLAYLQRGVTRLLDLLDGDKPFLCLMATRPWVTSEKQFHALAEALSVRSEQASLACIRIGRTPDGSVAQFGHHEIASSGQHRLFDYHSAGKFEPLGFANQLDDMAMMRWVRLIGASAA